ncbi:MAG TPA: DUF4126 domain-containing protein [Burkholderiales bacterium]|nr:DUF4126 domain-containing protein [Burkholderiales bacterium]
MDALATLSAAAGLAWASGLRVYLVLFVIGLLGRLGYLVLPDALAPLSNDWVLAASGVMTVAEFFADKIPVVDSIWDAVHSFIRIPAGAVLAAGMMGLDNPVLTMAAAILGGAVTSSAHLSKAGTRAVVNTSPEPFSNWAASFSEDGMALGAVWLAYAFPWIFLALLVLFLILVALLLPRLMRVLGALL